MKTLADVSGIQVQMGADILEREERYLISGGKPRRDLFKQPTSAWMIRVAITKPVDDGIL